MSYAISAQDALVISGTVYGDQGEPVFGDAILYEEGKEQPVKYGLIEEGKFEFQNLDKGSYLLELICLGFEDEKRHVLLDAQNVELEIKLTSSINDLDQVTVSAQRPTIENRNGNIKMTIDKSSLASLATPMDVLSRMPGIIVGPTGESLSVIGKGSPLIYVDNQRLNVEQLSSIPVEAIKSIEIINNPSAKYEASGRAVVFIERKSDYTDGYKIGLSEVASQRHRFNNYLTITPSLKKGKLEARANFSYNKLQPWESSSSETLILDADILTTIEGLSVAKREQYLMGAGVYYKINKGDYISINANLRTQKEQGPIVSSSTLRRGVSFDSIQTNVPELGERDFLTTNLNYNKSLANIGGNLFFGAQFSHYKRDLNSEISTNINETEFINFENRDQDFSIDGAAVRVDFEKEIYENLKLEAGVNISGSEAIAFSRFDFLLSDSTSTSNYNYSERNFASYIQVSGKLQKMNYQLGLRSELNQVEGKFENMEDLLIDRNNHRFFPKVNLSIPVDSMGSISLDYARTIRRPHYLNSSSISTYIGPVNEYTRNVNLRSSINDEVSLTYQFSKQSLSLRYSYVAYPTFQITYFDTEQDRLITSPENWDKQETVRLIYVYPVQLKKLRMTWYVVPTWTRAADSRALSTPLKPFLYLYNSTSYKLLEHTEIALRTWGMTKRNNGVADMNSLLVVGGSVSQTIFENFVVTVNANDIFKNRRLESSSVVNSIDQQSTIFTDAHEFSLSLKYNFGRQFKSSYKNKDVDDNLDRIN